VELESRCSVESCLLFTCGFHSLSEVGGVEAAAGTGKTGVVWIFVRLY